MDSFRHLNPATIRLHKGKVYADEDIALTIFQFLLIKGHMLKGKEKKKTCDLKLMLFVLFNDNL